MRLPDNGPAYELKPLTEVKVIGIGGGGNNAVNRMIEDGLEGVDLITLDTYAHALGSSLARRRIVIGQRLCKGLAAGGAPAIGEKAAEESEQDIRAAIHGASIVILAVGMGGGTGTGASPVVADLARDAKARTAAVVTTPFSFEGTRRVRVAEKGLQMLRGRVDALIAIPNDRLLTIGEKPLSIVEAFRLADDVLRDGVQEIIRRFL